MNAVAGGTAHSAIPARSGIFFEAEWVGAPGRTAPAPAPTLSPAPVLSPGLARLLNAALIDSTFAAHFFSSPLEAARMATDASGEAFGTTLPSPALRLSLPALSDAEWALLHRLPRTESLAAAAQELRRLAARAATYDVPPPAQRVEPVYPTALSAVPPRRPLNAPASPGGALAGAA